jgi:ribosome maturation factor RimP
LLKAGASPFFYKVIFKNLNVFWAMGLKLQEIIDKSVADMGLEMVEFKHNSSKYGERLFIYVDKKGGVTVDECAQLSRSLRSTISLEGIFFNNKFTLEVSSPGADRPLIKLNDFKRNIGKHLIYICKTNEPGKTARCEGELLSCSENGLTVLNSKKGKFQIQLERIESARVKLPF